MAKYWPLLCLPRNWFSWGRWNEGCNLCLATTAGGVSMPWALWTSSTALGRESRGLCCQKSAGPCSASCDFLSQVVIHAFTPLTSSSKTHAVLRGVWLQPGLLGSWTTAEGTGRQETCRCQVVETGAVAWHGTVSPGENYAHQTEAMRVA